MSEAEQIKELLKKTWQHMMLGLSFSVRKQNGVKGCYQPENLI